jgi:hypothetical protein
MHVYILVIAVSKTPVMFFIVCLLSHNVILIFVQEYSRALKGCIFL